MTLHNLKEQINDLMVQHKEQVETGLTVMCDSSFIRLQNLGCEPPTFVDDVTNEVKRIGQQILETKQQIENKN